MMDETTWNNTKKIFGELKLKEDKLQVIYLPENLYKATLSLDLTTPDGAFWIMSRLEGWDRFEEFIEHTVHFPNSSVIDYFISCDDDTSFAKALFTWLASDAKDGKAPALYNALCEFLEVEK